MKTVMHCQQQRYPIVNSTVRQAQSRQTDSQLFKEYKSA
jgi:hypothetical protein